MPKLSRCPTCQRRRRMPDDPTTSAACDCPPPIVFDRHIVVEVIAEDAEHCSIVCPLWTPPNYCRSAIPLEYTGENDQRTGKRRRYLRTVDCRKEEKNAAIRKADDERDGYGVGFVVNKPE